MFFLYPWSGADPENFSGEMRFGIRLNVNLYRDVRSLDPEKSVNKFFEKVSC